MSADIKMLTSTRVPWVRVFVNPKTVRFSMYCCRCKEADNKDGSSFVDETDVEALGVLFEEAHKDCKEGAES